MTNECIFCKIIKGEIPCKKVFENEFVIAFHDIKPKAKTHVLIIPKSHIDEFSEIAQLSSDMIINCIKGVADVGKILGLDHYKVLINNGAGSGQEVFHLHIHLISDQAI